MARNPWPIKVNECGSNGPFDTAILLLMNKNKNWNSAEAKPKTIAYTGLLM